MEFPRIHGAKRRFQALLIAMMLLLILAYFLSFNKTIAAFSLMNDNEKALHDISNAPQQIQQYKSQLDQLESTLIQSSYNRQELFEAVNTFCEEYDLKISYFHPEQRNTQNEYALITNQIDIEGDFKDIVQFVYYIEHTRKLGHIVSTIFEKKTDRRSKRKYLLTEVYIQNILQANLSSNDKLE